MRVTRIVAASLGSACCVLGLNRSSHAALAFSTLLDNQASGASGTVSAVEQVTVGPSGDVAVLGTIADNSSQGSHQGILYTPTAGATLTKLAEADGTQTVWVDSTAWGNFTDLSLTGNSSGASRLTFVGYDGSDPANAGVYQYDPSNASGTQQHQVLVQGGSIPTTGNTADLDTLGSGETVTVPYAVNPTGQVAFGVKAKNGSNQYILQGDGSNTLQIALDANASSLSNVNTLNVPRQQVLAANGSVYFLASPHNSSTVNLYKGGPSQSPSVLINGSTGVAAGGLTYYPQYAYGTTGSNVLFLGGTSTGTLQQALFLGNGTTVTQIGNNFATSAQPTGAEMSSDGKVAFYTPDGTQIDYVDSTKPSVVDSLTMSSNPTFTQSGTHFTLTGIGTTGSSSPMVNANSQVVFDGTVQDATNGDSYTALLYWQPGVALPSGGLSIVAIVDQGDDSHPNGTLPTDSNGHPVFGLPIGADGTIERVYNLYLNSSGTSPGNVSDNDVFDDSLNDNGQLAFAVDYATGSNDDPIGTAVLETTLTAVPEPASISLVALTGLPLLTRRRRR